MKKIYFSALCFLAAGFTQAQNFERMSIVEGFSSATCPPCYTWNQSYSPVLQANNANSGASGSIAVVKFQMDWPSPGDDPSYNDDASTRRGFYGVTSIPEFFIDGEANDGSQGTIDAHSAIDAEVEVNAAFTITGNDIDINVEITPNMDLGGGSRLYIALANKEYQYPGQNGETEFHHVMRKMIPTAGGINVGFLDSGVTLNFNEAYTYAVASGNPAQNSNDLWDNDLELVVWVQKANSKQMWNAAVAGQGTLGIQDGDADDFGLVVYPNPSTDMANVIFDANGENTNIEVYNSLGQMVLSENKGAVTGRQQVRFNATDLEAGMYFVRVQMGDRLATSQLMIQK